MEHREKRRLGDGETCQGLEDLAESGKGTGRLGDGEK